MKYCKILSCKNIESRNFRKFICCQFCDEKDCTDKCYNDPKKCMQNTENRVVMTSGGIPKESKRRA